jgi:prevent-host-death family protein
MIQTTITTAKAKLSYFIDLAKNGETILITDRGVPVVRLESAARPARTDMSPEDAGRLYRLEKAGILRVSDKPMDLSWLEGPLPVPKDGGSVLKALLDEREESR